MFGGENSDGEMCIGPDRLKIVIAGRLHIALSAGDRFSLGSINDAWLSSVRYQ